jgi:ATP-binding cassette subfamily F protein 3
MTLVDLQNVTKSFGNGPVFQDVSWQVNSSGKIGLIGANGTGKTTLFRIIAGELTPDEGRVYRAKGLRIGFLRQEIQLSSELTLFDEMLKPFADLLATHRKLEELQRAMANTRQGRGQHRLSEILHRYSQLHEAYEHSGGYTYELEIRSVLFGLGFSEADLNKKASVLSGGQKNIAALAQVLLSKPKLLLLDEPTNHLDIAATRWLERFLKDFPGAVIVVSHDRFLLERAVQAIAELDTGHLQLFPGIYSAYFKQKRERQLQQLKQYQLQQEEIRRAEEFIRRNIAGQKTKQAQSRRKALQKMERVAPPPSQQKQIRPIFKSFGREGRVVLSCKNLEKKFATLTLFSNLNLAICRGERVALLGPNGSGKSTLLKILAGRQSPDAGDCRIGHNVRLGYYQQDQEGLNHSHTVLQEVWRARPNMLEPELRYYLARFLFAGEEILRPVGSLSGGERSRVALAKLMLTEANLLLLDEPTNHLDIASRKALESALSQYDGTLLVVSHDRYFLDQMVERILHLEGGRVREYLGNYSSYHEKRAQEEALIRKKRARKKGTTHKLPKWSGPSKKKLESLEAEIAYLEKELEEIDRLLKNSELSTDWQALRSLQEQHQDLSDSLDGLLVQWLEISEAVLEGTGESSY